MNLSHFAACFSRQLEPWENATNDEGPNEWSSARSYELPILDATSFAKNYLANSDTMRNLEAGIQRKKTFTFSTNHLTFSFR